RHRGVRLPGAPCACGTEFVPAVLPAMAGRHPLLAGEVPMRSTTILWATGALLLAATTTATAQQPQHAAPVNGPHQSTMARKSPATTSASPAPAPTASTPASIRIREAHPGLLAKATVK